MSKLRRVASGKVGFYCPGCKCHHVVPVTGSGSWQFNGDFDKPTITPSILVKTFVDENGSPLPQDKPRICHSHVTNGIVKFCGDCYHAWSGKDYVMEDDNV